MSADFSALPSTSTASASFHWCLQLSAICFFAVSLHQFSEEVFYVVLIIEQGWGVGRGVDFIATFNRIFHLRRGLWMLCHLNVLSCPPFITQEAVVVPQPCLPLWFHIVLQMACKPQIHFVALPLYKTLYMYSILEFWIITKAFYKNCLILVKI